ncbi:MAG: asparaginase [Candidatus Nanopelagicales bacterium]
MSLHVACHDQSVPTTDAPANARATSSRATAIPLAAYSRSGVLEGVFYGHAVILDLAGNITQSWGSTTELFFPRSSNKIAQATAMSRLGLQLPQHLQALTGASHSGEAFHIEGVREILNSVNLTPAALQTPPDFPLDRVERDACIARGEEPAPILMNCSGKHAGMLVTCVINGWDIDTYLELNHPLQQAIKTELASMTSADIDVIGTDGCGAPVMALSLPALARLSQNAVLSEAGTPARTVADAFRTNPEYVGGTRRDVTHFMQRIPGLLAKDGAEGVYTASFADGRAIALKMEDGSDRGRNAAMAGILVLMGVGPELVKEYLDQPLLGGGRVVGSVYPLI